MKDAAPSWCVPAYATDFVPSPYVSAFHQADACTDAESAAFYTACIDTSVDGGATMAACDAFKASAPRCSACIDTADSNGPWGAFVLHNGMRVANIAGCIELLGGPSALACAKATQTAQACGESVCDFDCTVEHGASPEQYAACTEQALTGVCSGYDPQIACQPMTGDAGAVLCFGGQTPRDRYDVLVAVFCGGGSVDGGAD